MYSPHAYVYTQRSLITVLRKSSAIVITLLIDGVSIKLVDLQRFSPIPEELAKQALRDKSFCEARAQPYEVIRLINIGTTFIGGRDNVLRLRQALRDHDTEISYNHADGALDSGFPSDTVCLGRPDLITKNNLPVVQDITFSHHKAFGIMVSGEVISFSPNDKKLAIMFSNAESPSCHF